ncbi:MAG: efflux RND transporter periplasmic adaptor subunit, partial [Flammeovirgaceae bacterium]
MKAILYILLFLGFISCQQQENVIQAEYKKLTEAVYASGNVLPTNDHKLYTEATGFLVEQLVDEGDEVKKGQVLFIIKSHQQDSRTQAAKTAYQIAQLNNSQQSPVINDLKISLAKAHTKLQNDSINYFRQKQLFSKKATSKVQYEQAHLAYQVARNEIQSLQNRLQQTENQLLVEMKNAESQYRIQSDEQRNHQVISDMDGVIFEIYKNKGELIRRNEAIAMIGNKSETYIQLAVDELDIGKLQIGQPIILKVDVFPNKYFKAQVSKLYPMMNQRDQSFRVDALFSEKFDVPYAGLNVEANIVINEKEQVLALPKTVLVGTDSIWILDEAGDKKKISIERGLVTMEYVEIL